MIGFPRSKETIRQEAAAWVARLKDAHSDVDRRRFEAWLAQDSAHQRAYDQAAAAYAASAQLSASGVGRGRDLESAFRNRGRPLVGGLVTTALAGILLVGAYQFHQEFNPFGPIALESVMLSTSAEAKEVRLVDGSTVSMAPDSEVRIDLNRAERIAQVRRGKIRLAIARDKRPFVIVAGGTRVRANAGVFAAQVSGGSGTVVPVQPSGARESVAGEQGGPQGKGQSVITVMQTMEFDAEPLGSAINRINEVHAGPRLELDRDLANLRVTGVFQQGDSLAIGRSLALAFNLRLIQTPAGTLRLSSQK